MPVFLEIPGPPGRTSGLARLNEALAAAVYAHDKPAVLQILRQGYAQGRHGDHQPVTFTTAPE